MAFLGPGGGNKTVCRVMGPEMKKKNIGDTFLNFTTYLATYPFMLVCVFDQLLHPLPIQLFQM